MPIAENVHAVKKITLSGDSHTTHRQNFRNPRRGSLEANVVARSLRCTKDATLRSVASLVVQRKDKSAVGGLVSIVMRQEFQIAQFSVQPSYRCGAPFVHASNIISAASPCMHVFFSFFFSLSSLRVFDLLFFN